MSALEQLAALLQPAVEIGARPMPEDGSMARVVDWLQARAQGDGPARSTRLDRFERLPDDRRLDALARFRTSDQVPTFRDAYLLSWSLCIPHGDTGPCLIEDGPRLARLLEAIDAWQANPGAYRRCYLGLVNGYFQYDAWGDDVPAAAREGWEQLRDYLHARNPVLRDGRPGPAWVATAIEHRELFGPQPLLPYIDTLLHGDATRIERMCRDLGIGAASWFRRELILTQAREAAQLDDARFLALLPRLITLMAGNPMLRDRGTRLLLDRHARVADAAADRALQAHAIGAWGIPWLATSELRWRAVTPAARAMAADALKAECLEAFFTMLTREGKGDPRRLAFWKRYIGAIDHIELALGSQARTGRKPELVALRQKMGGLLRTLDVTGAHNAIILRMGPLVAVEFSGSIDAFYGYDARVQVPFDTAKPLSLEGDGWNSLKHRSASVLWMGHVDGVQGWARWEAMFEAKLREGFGIAAGDGGEGVETERGPLRMM